MKKSISFDIELPRKVTHQELEEWLKFNMYIIPNLSEKNPLGLYELDEAVITKLHIMEPEKDKWI